MNFVGYMVSPADIGMDLEKNKSIQEWPVPTLVKEVQSFLGFANFYRKFINNYSRLATPLTTLTKKSVKFTWSHEAEAAFRSLQKAFTSAPVLKHYQPHLPLTMEVDASDFALGCILSQPSPPGDLHSICFYSKKNTPAELNYPIYDKELMVVVELFRQWRVFMEGAAHPVRVFTNHKNVEYFTFYSCGLSCQLVLDRRPKFITTT